MATKIGIAGITGRVGTLLVHEVLATTEAVLVGGYSRNKEGKNIPTPLFQTLAELAAVCDVVIDFTHASTINQHAKALVQTQCAWILGTTGISPADQKEIVKASHKIAIVQASNFSAGVVLATRIAAQLAKALPASSYDIEIVESHHRQKVDAPSGTALSMGKAIAEARGIELDSMRESGRDGITGPRKTGAIGFSSLRAGQIIGEHEVSFTSADEQIILTHKAFNRSLFAKGAVQAALWSKSHRPGLYSMENVLELE
ncbi:4-hydroxy-tetrahydrodipicolinate reductase [Entomobacter blattae]|uniref:4-hydroxy-tetrahydrodipicolinate reductase n=1 Tax=Entomobacter blattae TaxID=2762277 RepID=A0A7H1NPU0_9PROT|nr:4-hydroxy-tetrahydrodipicolinate reductase [Entomobacter blattae]QNT77800.1 4-hydroxy-tetrahydrodipicolinate reductase [Entomobacter blattae]